MTVRDAAIFALRRIEEALALTAPEYEAARLLRDARQVLTDVLYTSNDVIYTWNGDGEE